MSRAVALLAVLGLAGCAEPRGPAAEVIEIDRWQLSVPGSSAAEPVPVQLPDHLADRVPDRAPRYLLRTEVALPPALRGRPLTLTLLSVQARMDLRAGGAAAIPLDRSPLDRFRSRPWQAWRIPPAAGPRLELELAVDNAWSPSTWLEGAPRLSATQRGDPHYRLVAAWNEWTGGGALAVLALLTLVFLATFAADRRRAAEGWFALVLASVAVVTAFLLGLTQPVLGLAEGPVAITAVTVALLASLRFSHALFGLGPPSRAWLLGLPLLAVVLVGFSDPMRGARIGVPISSGFWFAVLVYQVLLLARLRRRPAPPPGTGPLLACWIVVLLATGAWMLPWIGLGHLLGGVQLGPAGFLFYAVVQAIAVSRDRATAAEQAARLTRDLEERVRELEARERELDALNQDLRGEIARRSGRLARALAAARGSD